MNRQRLDDHHGHATAAAAPTMPGAGAPARSGTRYTCPMHPEIIRDAPGHCPICGMALESVLPGVDDDELPEIADFRRRFWWTLPLTLATLVLAMIGHRLDVLDAGLRSWLELALSAPVVLWAG